MIEIVYDRRELRPPLYATHCKRSSKKQLEMLSKLCEVVVGLIKGPYVKNVQEKKEGRVLWKVDKTENSKANNDRDSKFVYIVPRQPSRTHIRVYEIW